MKKLIIVFFVFPLFTLSQKNNGVFFESKITNWNAVVAKAKKENKYIFVDCYTTWCKPCKEIRAKVFTLKKVGDFFNSHFVNIAFQIDSTKKDNTSIVATRKIFKHLKDSCKINYYPTFLIFINTGKLVHKFTRGENPNDIIDRAREGLQKSEQYYTLVEKLKMTQDKKLLETVCAKAFEVGDNIDGFLKLYIESNTNLFTKENGNFLIKYLDYGVKSFAFEHLYNNYGKWKTVLGEEKINENLENSVAGEIVTYSLFNEDRNTNWDSLVAEYDKRYPEFGKAAVLKVKPEKYSRNNDLKNYIKGMQYAFEQAPKNVYADELDNIARAIFENINDKELLSQALSWSKMSLEKEELAAYLDTYANLLYKLGQTNEAIDAETRALSKATNDDEKKSYQNTLSKMKKGEKTWK